MNQQHYRAVKTNVTSVALILARSLWSVVWSQTSSS